MAVVFVIEVPARFRSDDATVGLLLSGGELFFYKLTQQRKKSVKGLNPGVISDDVSRLSMIVQMNVVLNGQFQKISIPNHGRLPCFNPPLPSEIPKCATPPMPSEFHSREPPPPLQNFRFFLEVHFRLSNAYKNEHEFMPPQGCDLAAPGDKLYSSVTRKTYASDQAVQTPF